MLLIICHKMLRGRYHFQIFRVIALQTLHESNSQLRCQIRIFSVSLGGSSPTRVARHVYGRRPKSQQVTIFILLQFSPTKFIPPSPRFIRSSSSYLVNQLRIPGRSQTYSLWEDGKLSRTHDTMQRLIPMIILLHSQARNGRSQLVEDGHFLRHRHLRQEVVYSFIQLSIRIFIHIHLAILVEVYPLTVLGVTFGRNGKSHDKHTAYAC